MLTLKVDRLSTVHSITASLPTGTVTLPIGPINLGLSETKACNCNIINRGLVIRKFNNFKLNSRTGANYQ